MRDATAMSSNPVVSLQASKKILIFLYVICIFIFLFISLFFLHLKSENYKKNLDAELITAFNRVKDFKVTYDNLEGDILSKIGIYALNIKRRLQPTAAEGGHCLFSANKAILSLHPLSNIISYLSRTDIPVSLNLYANRLVINGETTEISVIANTFKITHYYRAALLKAGYETVFDIASKYVKTAHGRQISVKGTAEIKEGLDKLDGVLAARGVTVAISGKQPGSALSYYPTDADARFKYDAAEGRLDFSGSMFKFGSCEVNIINSLYSFASGRLDASLVISGLNTADIFRAFPVSKLLVMSESAEIELKYGGPIADLRGGSLSARLLFTRARLLEYNTEENRVFTDVGAGDFVTSLGLGPELVAPAETIAVLLALKDREIIVESLKVKSRNYSLAASLKADSSDILDGGFTLSIPRRVLKNNTLKADFSKMKKGLKIYGKIIGDLYNPFIIYDMDGAAIIKITEGVMFDKLKNIFKK